ncbi:hypothetical protein GGS23DRAFT_615722, partial [Durotheca rogersii]|uniref:uncharacterized protein n=1 Tax=Durotheca rogersii TaxID=419775 RepID=UPI00221FB3F6
YSLLILLIIPSRSRCVWPQTTRGRAPSLSTYGPKRSRAAKAETPSEIEIASREIRSLQRSRPQPSLFPLARWPLPSPLSTKAAVPLDAAGHALGLEQAMTAFPGLLLAAGAGGERVAARLRRAGGGDREVLQDLLLRVLSETRGLEGRGGGTVRGGGDEARARGDRGCLVRCLARGPGLPFSPVRRLPDQPQVLGGLLLGR